MNDGFEDFIDANSFFGARQDGCIAGDCQDFLKLRFRLCHICVWQVDLIDHWNDLQVLLHRQMHIGHGLRFDALGGVDDK